jgi:hypothetical protein
MTDAHLFYKDKSYRAILQKARHAAAFLSRGAVKIDLQKVKSLRKAIIADLNHYLPGFTCMDETHLKTAPSLIITLIPFRPGFKSRVITLELIKEAGGSLWVSSLFISAYYPLYTVTRCYYEQGHSEPIITRTRHPRVMFYNAVDKEIDKIMSYYHIEFLPYQLTMKRYPELRNEMFEEGHAP